MIAATLLYLVSYFVFSFSTKYLAAATHASVLVLASTLGCITVCAAALLCEALVARVRHVPSALSRLLPRLRDPDVVVAAAGSAVVLLASTVAYGTRDVSLLLPLLLMKGGVLLWGPVVDWLRGEASATRSKLVLVLAVLAVVLVLWQKFTLASVGVGVALICALVYVAAYFPKIAVMARHRGDYDFLLAEMTLTLAIALPGAATIALVHAVAGVEHASLAVALSAALHALQHDLGALLCMPALYVLALGSEGAGLFGGILFLAPIGATLSVPLNRCTSLIAGFAATVTLWLLGGKSMAAYLSHNSYELCGVMAMLAALGVGLSGSGEKKKDVVEIETATLMPQPT